MPGCLLLASQSRRANIRPHSTMRLQTVFHSVSGIQEASGVCGHAHALESVPDLMSAAEGL